jgi:type I restriction enzyme, S subunit
MKNWTKTELRNVIKTAPQYGANASAIDYVSGKTLRFVRITDIDDNGRLKDDGKAGISLENGSQYILEKDDIVIARTGATVGKALRFKESYGKCAFAGYLIKFKIDKEKYNVDFLSQYLYSPLFKKWIKDTLRAGAQPNINAEEYQSVVLPNPPLTEQKKIAGILSKWDSAIETCERLIGARVRRKHALMQQLLSGKKRFPQFQGQAWTKYKISELFEEVARYVNWSDEQLYKLVSIRRRFNGLFLRGDFLGRQIAVKKLKSVHTGDFLISKRQVSHGAWSVVSPEFDNTKVSDEYDCLAVKDPSKINIDFWGWYCKTPQMQRYSFLSSNGVHIEKLIFDFDDFKKRSVIIPSSLEEQKRIAEVLNAADAEINLLTKKLEALRNQKRGLMQVLLTGKVRVKVVDEAEEGKAEYAV